MSEEGGGNPFAVSVELKDRRAETEPRRGFFAALDTFFKSSVGAAALTLISTTLLGGFIGYLFTELEREKAAKTEAARKENDNETEQAKSDTANRASLITAATKLIGARRVDANILRSAILHRASVKQVDARWSDYQKAYIDYNPGVFAFRFAALSYLGAQTTNAFAPILEGSISDSFQRVDDCLTEAYFWYTNKDSGKAKDALDNCRTRAAAAAPRDIAKEMALEDECIQTFEKELAYSIYIENNYEDLLDKVRKQPTVYTSDKLIECTDAGNWVCLRQINHLTVKERLEKGCDALDGIDDKRP